MEIRSTRILDIDVQCQPVKEIMEMPVLHTYRLFISHAWEYNEDYYRLINFLYAAPSFKYTNFSIPEYVPVDAGNNNKLVQELQRQIRPAEVVIILGGMHVTYSDWIQFEMEYAIFLGKPILGVKPWGARVMPKAVQDVAYETVGWNTTAIVGAIRRLALNV